MVHHLKMNKMNIIKIDGIIYSMPLDPEMYHSVLNHIDMVRKGVKDFAKMFTLEGKTVKLSTLVLKDASITALKNPSFFALFDVQKDELVDIGRNSTSVEELRNIFVNSIDLSEEEDAESVRRDYFKQACLDFSEFISLYDLKLIYSDEPFLYYEQ